MRGWVVRGVGCVQYGPGAFIDSKRAAGLAEQRKAASGKNQFQHPAVRHVIGETAIGIRLDSATMHLDLVELLEPISI